MTAPASIVLFVGQRIGPAGEPTSPFPPALEPALEAAIRDRLIEMGVMIGYSSAMAGADILFGEQLLVLGGELNLILPCNRDDFVRQYVAPSGAGWVNRFDALCAGAASVVIACEEKLLGDALLLRFNNQMLQGMARLRGDALGLPPHLLLAWCPAQTAEPGSPADAMDLWPEVSRLAIIDLDDVREGAGLPAVALPDSDAFPADTPDDVMADISPRAIRALLFGDIEAYTQVADEEIPLLFDFLAEAQQQVSQVAPQPLLIDSWGDAVHAVSERVHDLADWTMELTRAVATIDHRAFGLRRRPQFRMALHVGPVFVGVQPLTGRGTAFGHHVSRAARIEPIVTAGAVCASAHFVAALKAEMDERADVARQTGEDYAPRYTAVYLGEKELPKGFGRQDLYQLMERDTPGPLMKPAHDSGLGRLAAPRRLSLTLPGEHSAVAAISARLGAFCALHRVSASTGHALQVALDELVANTISHGFAGVAEPRIDLVVERADQETIRVGLSDNGGAFDPFDAPEPDLGANLDDRPIGGLGVYLVRELMDDVRYERRQGCNHVTLIKRLEAEAVDPT